MLSMQRPDFKVLSARPYQLMCLICRGADPGPEKIRDKKLRALRAAVRQRPGLPLMLRCNVDSLYRYQNPGRRDDTPGGRLFNDKRDLDIIQKMGLLPGVIRPAREIFMRLFEHIPTARGICGYAAAGAGTWRGCPRANSGWYEKGHAAGLASILSGRSREELAAAKKKSTRAMYGARQLWIRPHHLMCMTCFHAGRKCLAPIVADNLFEAVDIIQKNPDIPVKLIAGCCMVCPSCAGYDPRTRLCVAGVGMGLRDQKKDLDLLQVLGLKFGDVLPARRLYRLLYRRIHSTRQICGYNDGLVRGPEWTICGGPDGNPNYAKGRQAGLGIRGLN